MADEHHSGRIAEHILEIGISRRLGVLLFEHFAHSVEKLRIVHHAYCPGLFVLSVGGIDATVQDDFIVSRFTASGLYLRMLRRDMIVSITASELLFSVTVLSLSFCACGPHADNINRPAPNNINFKLFIFCIILVIRFVANLTKKRLPKTEAALKYVIRFY